MRAAIFNPYLDTLGGGERYTLTFAKVLLEEGYSVDLEWRDEKILDKLSERFGLNLDGVRVVNSINRGDGYDLCFWVSDGSIPALKARRNILHFQVPFLNVNGKSLMNKMKLFRISKIVCNSLFTKKFIDNEYGLESIVIYPPVDIENFKPKKKENLILSVGRFSRLLQSKHQDILIKAFQHVYDSGLRDWKFILAGGSEVGNGKYTDELKKLTKGYPIQIIESPNYKKLTDMYGRSKIFWTASGFGESDETSPGKVEHFGITVVEAMAAGAIPFAYNSGGHKEIIKNEINGFLWESENQLLDITNKLIKDAKLARKIAIESIKTSTNFSYEKFKENFIKIL